MQITKPFPDELALTHLYRLWALNNVCHVHFSSQVQSLITGTKNLRQDDFPHPWTPSYFHQIVAHLSGMAEQDYRAQHTLLALSRDWQFVYSTSTTKDTKVNAYAIQHFHAHSAASDSPFGLCSACRQEDIELHGMAYWHRSHHIPGVDVCPKHLTPLQKVNWSTAYATPSPAVLQGEYPGVELIQANFHPAIQRYREISLHVLIDQRSPQYWHAHQQLLERASRLGLSRMELNQAGTYRYLEHKLPGYLYQHLPQRWLTQHFAETLPRGLNALCGIEGADYHRELKRLGLTVISDPKYLLLALSTVFESTEQIRSFLFGDC